MAGCEPYDKPQPIDTRASAAGGFNGADIGDPFGDENGGISSAYNKDMDRDPGMLGAGGEGMNWENIDPADIVETIYFGFDQYAIPQGEREKAKNVANFMKSNQNAKVALVAHTDWYGTEEYNLVLSDKRGASVQAYLKNLGIDNSRSEVVARGKNGATNDVAKNSPEAKRDRRVDVVNLK
ncbi:MAG: OmpA family protein [Opitutales bacterium]|nr:OmpA family protein [Opitutales bacterium]